MSPAQPAGSPSPARRAALEVARRARDPRAPGCDDLLEAAARRHRLSPADRGFARELVFGLLRNRAWLDERLRSWLEHPVDRFSEDIHEALLLGLYQAICLETLPDHAVADESVRLVASVRGGSRLRGLTNAVVRRALREGRGALRPGPETPWAVRHSVPDYVRSLAVRALLEEAEPFFAASNEPAPLCFRVTRGADPGPLRVRLDEEIAAATNRVDAPPLRQSALLPECLLYDGRGLNPADLAAFREGDVTIEDEGAQAALALAAAGLGAGHARTLDLCAAPGGKTAHLADLLAPDAPITACDVSDAKLARLRETLRRLGHEDRISICRSDSLEESHPAGAFDFVLLDAPCSGLGTLRRHPEIRYRRAPKDIETLVATQRELLQRAARFTAPGGLLAYTVCTVTLEEGDDQRDWFLEGHREFTPDPAPEAAVPFDEGAMRLDETGAAWRLLPHREGCDGFTVFRFRRNG